MDALLEEARGRVYTKEADKRELPRLKKEFRITSMHTQGSRVYLRFLSETPVSDAQICEPNIEDAYMLHLYRNGAQNLEGEAGGEG